MKSKIEKEISNIVERKFAKVTKHSKYGNITYGEYEGFGFGHYFACPNTLCKYYKYIDGLYWSSVCTHPEVSLSVCIGGVYKCPKK